MSTRLYLFDPLERDRKIEAPLAVASLPLSPHRAVRHDIEGVVGGPPREAQALVGDRADKRRVPGRWRIRTGRIGRWSLRIDTERGAGAVDALDHQHGLAAAAIP